FLIACPWIKANDRIGQRMSGAPIEDIALDLFSAFQSERYISAEVEGFLKCRTDFFAAGQLGNPAFQVFAFAPGRVFKFFRIGAALRNAHYWGALYSGNRSTGDSVRQETPYCCHKRNHGLCESLSSCLRLAAATSLAVSGRMSESEKISSSCSISAMVRSTSICLRSGSQARVSSNDWVSIWINGPVVSDEISSSSRAAPGSL